MVKVERRYQYRGREGIKWTSWFKIKEFDQTNQAKTYITMMSKQKEADKKLSGEYRIV